MDYPWHYHPEYEIIFVEKSYGIRLMGNHIGNFTDGDLMFISPNLPHVWRNVQDFYKGNKNLSVDVYVIHFREDALGKEFFQLPEFFHIRKLFQLGEQGFLIKTEGHEEISCLIKSVYNSLGVERLKMFLTLLDRIARLNEYELLSGPGYTDLVDKEDADRINKVVEHLMQNYMNEIQLEKIAQLINLNKSSFCRYFKSRTNKTFSEFLNEIRIAHACKLLTDNNKNITQVCYEVGYNNISYFNRQFKRITGKNARQYVKEYLEPINNFV
jgi:AraC-like DNA-binding protein